MLKEAFVYILTNERRSVLYTGVTNNLQRRISEHKFGSREGFAGRYGADRLIYYEVVRGMDCAIRREKQIKAGSRRKKIEMIERMNPEWKDLYLQQRALARSGLPRRQRLLAMTCLWKSKSWECLLCNMR